MAPLYCTELLRTEQSPTAAKRQLRAWAVVFPCEVDASPEKKIIVVIIK
jgi:hypothetical protein